MEVKRLQIAVKLESPINKEIIALNRKCRKIEAAEFFIDGTNFFPHITIYPPEFPTHNLNKIIAELTAVAQRHKSFRLEIADLQCAEGFIMVHFKNDSLLHELHTEIVKALNPLREGILRSKYSDSHYMEQLPEAQKKLIYEYGYQYVFEYYHPHITLMKYEDIQIAQKVYNTMQKDNWLKDINYVDISTIAIFEVGENASCINIIQEFALERS